MAQVIDYDPLTGLRMTFEHDELTDTTVIGYHQDCTAVIDDNKAAMQNVERHKKQSKGEWAHYAKVPIGIQYKWLLEHGVDFGNPDHWPDVMKLINSREYCHLKRTTYFHDR
jgi:hypothetical protein